MPMRAQHVKGADEAVHIGGLLPAMTIWCIDLIIDAIRRMR